MKSKFLILLSETRRKLYSGASASRAVSGEPTWQPIETASKDGTRILATGSNGSKLVVEAYYLCPSEETRLEQPEAREGWYWRGPIAEPTHWMPLPASPSAAVSEGEKQKKS